jgi:hypothetical protein
MMGAQTNIIQSQQRKLRVQDDEHAHLRVWNVTLVELTTCATMSGEMRCWLGVSGRQC